MNTLKTFDNFHSVNENTSDVIGVIHSAGANDITVKNGKEFVTITQNSSLSKAKNVIVVPYDALREFIRDINSIHGYFVEEKE